MGAASQNKTLHGVNLAGWLVPEPWVTPELFADTGAHDDLSLMEQLGPTAYNELVIAHRESFVTELDFVEMQHRGFDAVRIPVPWYAFGEAGPVPEGHVGCLDNLDKAFEWAEAHEIAVLLVLAVTPGANISDDGFKLQLTEVKRYREAALDVVAALVSRYADKPCFLGIEPLDEAQIRHRVGLSFSEGVPISYVRNYYRDAYRVVRDIAGSKPVVVISDADAPGAWKNFMPQSSYSNVWLDSHLYRSTDAVESVNPSTTNMIVRRLQRRLIEARKSGLPVMVGEWSSALPLAEAQSTEEGRLALLRVYTGAQLQSFDSCPAWFYQTWKTSSRSSGWDARVAFASFDRDMLD